MIADAVGIVVATESQTPSRSFGPPSPPTVDQDDTHTVELENRALRDAWLQLRRVRRSVEQALRDYEADQRDLQHQLNAAELHQQHQLLEFQSLLSHQRTLSLQLRHSQRWNALNDCFRIATKGAYGTINGLRLGSDAPVLECGNFDALVDTPTTSSNGQPASSTTSPPATGGPFSFFPSFPGVGDASASNPSPSGPVAPPHHHHHKMPWSEINAALGHVVLLLSELQHRLNRCNSVSTGATTASAAAASPSSSPDAHATNNAALLRYRHDLLPLGSTSKIGIRKTLDPTKGTPTWYNLWYSDETFQFFGRRNFNAAVAGLMECVWDASHIIQQHDRGVALPHDLVLPSQSPPTPAARGMVAPTEIVIDGLPVSYFGPDGRCGGVEWTRAMKYVLTNLKYLLTVRLVASCGGSLLEQERGTTGAPASASLSSS